MNDPRITAYALGELSGPEREAFELELAASEELQSQLQETIQLADTLGSLNMKTEALPEETRTALLAQCTANQRARRRRKVTEWVLAGSLAAAACLMAYLSAPAVTGALSKSGRMAKADEPVDLVDPITSELLRKEAKDFYAVGRFDLSEKRYREVLAANPQDPEARQGLEELEDARKNFASQTTPVPLVASTEWQPALRSPSGALPAAAPVDEFPSEPASTTGSSVASLSAAGPAGARQARVEASSLEGSVQYGAPILAGMDQAGAVALTATADRELAATAKLQTAAPSRESGTSSVSGDIPLAGRLFSDTDSLRHPSGEFNTEAYDSIEENVFLGAKENPLSTFSIDVDTASYANVRRFLQNDQLPPAGAIRTEEFLNYFSYAYPQSVGDVPFSVNMEVSRAPWDDSRELVRIGLKGRDLPVAERPPANLVFLIDVSGSMDEPDKLPLLKRSLTALVENLSPKDRVSMVVYAGSSGLVLPPTPGTEKPAILAALDRLQAGGSTNGASGIQLAYNTARENFIRGGNNRIILCTDGDFNVGTTDQSELVRLIEKERIGGIFLSVLGFGTGNLKDSTMEKLADQGNGNYAYIDSFSEGRKVLVEEMASTLFTIAKDVKIQVEFNPARVAGYRLIGYENRLLAKEDFNDDKKDAGEIGAGHTVTALYEIIPAGRPLPGQPSVDPLKYQTPAAGNEAKTSAELLTLKLRYKAPDGDISKLIEVPLRADDIPAFQNASSDFQFAAAVAAFALKLRNSPEAGELSWEEIQSVARKNLGNDPGSYRAEFLTLIEKASRLSPHPSGSSKEAR